MRLEIITTYCADRCGAAIKKEVGDNEPYYCRNGEVFAQGPGLLVSGYFILDYLLLAGMVYL